VRALEAGWSREKIGSHIVRHNTIFNCERTGICGSLCYDNSTDDLFVEVDHGPFLADNNLFLSAINLRDWSEGGAYAHNLMTGRIDSRPELSRSTPYHQAHSTALAGLTNISGGDNRFYNNVLAGGNQTRHHQLARKSRHSPARLRERRRLAPDGGHRLLRPEAKRSETFARTIRESRRGRPPTEDLVIDKRSWGLPIN